MTLLKIRLLVTQIVNYILVGKINYHSIEKIANDPKFDISEVKASVAAISFILKNAIRHAVDSDNLSNELQQLGLQKDTSIALSRIYDENSDKLTVCMKEHSLRLSRLIKVDWRVDYVLSSSALFDVNGPSFELNLRTILHYLLPNFHQVLVAISREKFRIILTELKQACKIMESAL
ncbi:COMM domain-containing protein 4-like isoform X1 [Oopsacas minuta]|uniref:COMM domain-containing protein 4-like isoform X1 n=1 Tax=Oopsacas minuta TaxID=111878 RepID=A0AAV7JIN9_9METZ|nr:COMM domain-containing protein 4-like isoform X1 [Oopsacas minuta]